MGVPPEDRYTSVFKKYYTKPKKRFEDDNMEVYLKCKMFDPNYNPSEKL